MAKQLMKVGLVVTVAMGLGGCSELPIVSNARVISHESLMSQQDWVQAQAEDAIAVMGKPDGWWVDVPELQWPRDTEKIIRGAITDICGSGKLGERPGELSIILSHDDFGDPTEAAQRLWDHWEAQGWELSYIIDPSQQPAGEIDFRADREDGAMLSFGGNAIYSSVWITSSCSDSFTVMKRY